MEKTMFCFQCQETVGGKGCPECDAFVQRALAATLDDSLDATALTALALETGKFGVDAMALLEQTKDTDIDVYTHCGCGFPEVRLPVSAWVTRREPEALLPLRRFQKSKSARRQGHRHDAIARFHLCAVKSAKLLQRQIFRRSLEANRPRPIGGIRQNHRR